MRGTAAAAQAPVVKAVVAKTPVAKSPVAKAPVAKAAVAKTPVAKAPAQAPPRRWAEGDEASVLTGEQEGKTGKVLSVDDDDITLLIDGDFVVLSASDITLAAETGGAAPMEVSEEAPVEAGSAESGVGAYIHGLDGALWGHVVGDEGT